LWIILDEYHKTINWFIFLRFYPRTKFFTRSNFSSSLNDWSDNNVSIHLMRFDGTSVGFYFKGRTLDLDCLIGFIDFTGI
jgi:hypothetical protein